MIRILLMGLMFVSSVAFAEEQTCANYAKYGAIKAYKSEMGVVQGSDGVYSEAQFVSRNDSTYKYNVTVWDNNEDGDVWGQQYTVEVKKVGTKCQLVSPVVKSDSVEANTEE